jgi:hypothetical protein
MSDGRQHDDRVAQNQQEQDITRRLAQKLQHLDAPRRQPPHPRRTGWRLTAQQYDLATDHREWQPGQGEPPLAHQRAQPTPVGQDVLDASLARRGGFDLRRRQPYALDEASRRLQQAFGEDISLRCAGKSRLAELGLLQDQSQPAAVPEELRQLKETMRRDAAQEATLNRRPSLQARLKALKSQLDQLLQDAGDEGDEAENGDWHDPRSQDMRASAAPRTNRQGVLVNAAGQPLTLRSQPD